jgi:DNA-binding response OmpR family regulator
LRINGQLVNLTVSIYASGKAMYDKLLTFKADSTYTYPQQIKVLIVDDDKKLCRLVADYLEPLGYGVKAAHNGPQAFQMILQEAFHIVILDVMLPGMDGFEILRRLRLESDIPVLMFTARGGEIDRVVGLEMGADDYLPKTFSNRELLARLRAVSRRYFEFDSKPAKKIDNEALILGDLFISSQARTVRIGEKKIELTALEFDLLVHLVKNSGKVLSRNQLIDAVAGRSYDVFDRSIDVHISSLRRKLGDDPRKPMRIITIRSVGYMFNSTGCQGL